MKKKSFVARRYLLLCSILLLSFCLGTMAKAQQTVLLKPINVSQIALLPTEKLDFWNRLDALSYKKNLSVVKVGDVPSLQQNGTLTFTIPGVAATITAKAIRVVDTDVKDYVWQAKIGETGYMQIVSKPDGVSGFIQLSNKYFTLFPLYKTYCALFEYDLNNLPNGECGVTNSVPTTNINELQSIDLCQEDANVLGATIDLLILVTPEARQWIGGAFSPNLLNALVYLVNGAESINLAFENSGIPNKTVRTRFSVFDDMNYSTEEDDLDRIEDDVDNLLSNPTAVALRNQFKADAVIMLTDSRYGNFLGIADQVEASNASAYGIVAIPFLLEPRFSLAHEFAHLLGARHNTSTNIGCLECGDDEPNCAHGWRFLDNNNIERRTILARTGDDPRIPHYSNPDVMFNGVATGDEEADNARIIRNNGVNIANFRSSPQMSAHFDGPKFLCNGSPQVYTADVAPPAPGIVEGQPPYTYEWSWNTTGIFNPLLGGTSTIIATGNVPSITLNVPPVCPTFFLQLRVTGTNAYSYRTSKLVYANFCTACGGSGKDIQTQSFSEANINVYPIPSDEQLFVQATQINNQEHQVQLCDLQGKIVYSTVVQVLNHQLQLSIPTAHLPQGFYYVRVLSRNAPIIKKIIIHH